ncbi:MAG TPA: ComF family protein [Syntrophales bacterium]|nr:ComF family protein [Syntrophales bacterium]HPX11276.1 ComF family protein [Syntrophales bacterium]HQB29847.1 ComF family protein [Syntrophales bacterium]HQN77235.1 ComF family protein [Syntrophales bacterium]HQQ26239.1 ComF family protein [Syntrophales bacterium]
MIRSSLASLARLVFPEVCPLCQSLREESPEEVFCTSCADSLPLVRPPLCIRCGLPFPAGEGENHLCGECLVSPPPFSWARALGRYETGLLDGIHRFKYRRAIRIGEGLGRLMAEIPMEGGPVLSSFDRVLPVPLHPARLRERGFNQSAVLAGAVSRRISLPLDLFSLRRIRDTKPQISLNGAERERNVRGAFSVARPPAVEGEKILLVDDVYTTGNTLREAARALLRGGASEVAVLTAARAVPRFLGG